MTAKKPTKKPAPRAKPRRAKPPAQSGAPVHDDFSAIIDMVADAKERGAFDPKNRPRIVAKPTVANTPGAPFARIVAGAKTEDPQFDRAPVEAQRHYEIGMSIGAFSLGRKFDGVLAWSLIDNRPFLRCMLGVGLCAWRFGNTREAAAVFRKMLWLNPSDNQGARFNLAAVEAGKTWEETEGDE